MTFWANRTPKCSHTRGGERETHRHLINHKQPWKSHQNPYPHRNLGIAGQFLLIPKKRSMSGQLNLILEAPISLPQIRTDPVVTRSPWMCPLWKSKDLVSKETGKSLSCYKKCRNWRLGGQMSEMLREKQGKAWHRKESRLGLAILYFFIIWRSLLLLRLGMGSQST